MNKICIIIPAFNEQGSIRSVIQEIKKVNSNFHIVVVNDASSDETLLEIKKENVTIINLPINLGIGGAVQTGLKYALNNKFSIAVQIDADGQHNPNEIPKLINYLNKDIDLIIGSRYIKFSKYNVTFWRNFGTHVFSNLIKITTGKRIYDATSGLRVFNKKALTYCSFNYPTDFPEPESIIDLVNAGFKIKEIPVTMHSRKHGKSSVNKLKAIYLMITISIAIIIRAINNNEYE